MNQLAQAHYDYAGQVSDKSDTLAALARRDKGLYPKAFCRIMALPEDLDPDAKRCTVFHADGVGTKVNHCLGMYRHTGDPRYVRSMPVNSLVMNLDDMLCVGAVRSGRRIFIVANYDLNQYMLEALAEIPGGKEFQNHLIAGEDQFHEMLRQKYKIILIPAGGETAKVADTTRTLNINHAMAVLSMPREEVIDNGRIQAGNIIVGLASYGRASWEDCENSGIRSNGLTDARHRLFGQDFLEANPDTFDPRHPGAYSGRFKLDDKLEESQLTIGEAIASPTRTFAPLISTFLAEVDNSHVCGMVHCSGGGATKDLHAIGPELRIVKDNMLMVPAIFRLLQNEGKVSNYDMWKIFNMGCGFEVFCANQATAATLIALSSSMGVAAQLIGHVDGSTTSKAVVEIHHNGECFVY